jgi:hypothetical protein
MRKDHPEYEKLSKDIPFARGIVDKFIDQLLVEFEDEKQYQKEMEEYEKEMEEYNRKMKEWEERQRTKESQKQRPVQIQSQKELDYSSMEKSDIQKLIDNALDKGDFKEVERLSNLPNYKR